MDTPEALLFTDLHGEEANLEDVLADGLDGDVSARVPGLVRLLRTGPEHQLPAAILLLGWGQPEGFDALHRWAAAPDQVPWRDKPWTWDRFSGDDDAFGRLAWAVEQSKWLPEDSDLKARQLFAFRALLAISGQVYVGRALGEALAAQPWLAAGLVGELGEALAAGARALELQDSRALRFQMAALIAPLALVDGAAAARAAAWVRCGADSRTLRELASALGRGRGGYVEAALSELVASEDPLVAEEARKSLTRARGPGRASPV